MRGFLCIATFKSKTPSQPPPLPSSSPSPIAIESIPAVSIQNYMYFPDPDDINHNTTCFPLITRSSTSQFIFRKFICRDQNIEKNNFVGRRNFCSKFFLTHRTTTYYDNFVELQLSKKAYTQHKHTCLDSSIPMLRRSRNLTTVDREERKKEGEE